MRITVGLVLTIFLMDPIEGAIVFDTLIPDNSSCTEPGGLECLCTYNQDCNVEKHFECIDYKCYCANPMHRIYDHTRSMCVGLVGSICNDERGGLKCIKNAECEDGRCVCREGYSANSKLMCHLSHGEACGPFQCNIDRGFACKSGLCQCLDSSYVYSAVTRKCFDPESVVANFIRWLGRTLLTQSLSRVISNVLGIPRKIIMWPKRLIRLIG